MNSGSRRAMILAGDIGGTKCNVAVFQESGAALQLVAKRRFATSEFASLEELLDRFFPECAREAGARLESQIVAAGFGVAGAVVDGRLVANNIPWELTASALAAKLRLDPKHLTHQQSRGPTPCGLAPLASGVFCFLYAGAA